MEQAIWMDSKKLRLMLVEYRGGWEEIEVETDGILGWMDGN